MTCKRRRDASLAIRQLRFDELLRQILHFDLVNKFGLSQQSEVVTVAIVTLAITETSPRCYSTAHHPFTPIAHEPTHVHRDASAGSPATPHACHSGPARGLRGSALVPLSPQMSRRSLISHSCPPAETFSRSRPTCDQGAHALRSHRPGTNVTRLSSPFPLGRLQLALMEWLPMLLALISPLYTSAAYTFARGTHQPPPFGSSRGCTDLEELLTDPRDYADAIDLCFDDQFSCPHAKPFVGEAMINASSGGNPATVQIKDSTDWLPALEPAHPSRGPRRTTKDFVPIVGCMVTNHQFKEPRFVLSAADVRCRPSTDAATFPAECDGGASQRNVMIESTEAAISFVERTTRQSARRELGITDNLHELHHRRTESRHGCNRCYHRTSGCQRQYC